MDRSNIGVDPHDRELSVSAPAADSELRRLGQSISTIVRQRQLIVVLTSRELKARYRGSVLGYFWSLANPLMLLGVYTLVFTRFFPRPDLDHFWLFLFSGILPWTFFAGAILESTNAIVGNAGLIKKVLFPAEALPLVVVLSHMIHFALALPVLLGASLLGSILGGSPMGAPLLLTPVLLLLQAVFVAGLSLMVASMSVLFRDLRDLVTNLLQLGFFLTPVIYLIDSVPSAGLRAVLRLNPMTPFVRSWQQVFFFGATPGWSDMLLMIAYSFISFVVGMIVFERLRDSLAEAL